MLLTGGRECRESERDRMDNHLSVELDTAKLQTGCRKKREGKIDYQLGVIVARDCENDIVGELV